MSYHTLRGPCPAKVRLFPTHPHGGTPAKMADCASQMQSHTIPHGGMAREVEGRGPERGQERPAMPGAFAPFLGVAQFCTQGSKTQNSRWGLLPPIFGGTQMCTPFFLILGPGARRPNSLYPAPYYSWSSGSVRISMNAMEHAADL